MKRLLLILLLLLPLLYLSSETVYSQTPELILPIGHSDGVIDASYSPDGKKIATASADRTVKIWNAESGRLLLTLDGFTSFDIVSTVRFSPDGKSILTRSEVGRAKVWDSNNGKLLLDPDYEASIAIDDSINDVMADEVDSHDPERVKYSPDGKYLLAIGSVIKMWDVRSNKLHYTLHGHLRNVKSIVFSPDGKILLSNSGDGSAQIWNTKDGSLIRELAGKRGSSGLSTATFSPDGQTILAGSGD